jgi:hypothetical protein
MMRMNRTTSLTLALLLCCVSDLLLAQGKVAILATTPHRFRVEGRVTDVQEKVLAEVTLRVDTNGVFLQDVHADGKGRFAMDLDVGGFYGISVQRPGFIKKRFIVDARSEKPETVIAGPFHADISLTSEEALGHVDISELDFPYALVTYSPKDRAFLADPSYIEEMKRVESALLLSSAFARKKAER